MENETVTDAMWAEYKADMEKAGKRDGKNAAEWATQDLWGGRTTRGEKETAQRFLDGIEECDPEIMDLIPHLDLSGQWANGVTEEDVLANCDVDVEGTDPEDLEELIEAYRDAYDGAALEEIERSARAFLDD